MKRPTARRLVVAVVSVVLMVILLPYGGVSESPPPSPAPTELDSCRAAGGIDGPASSSSLETADRISPPLGQILGPADVVPPHPPT